MAKLCGPSTSRPAYDRSRGPYDHPSRSCPGAQKGQWKVGSGPGPLVGCPEDAGHRAVLHWQVVADNGYPRLAARIWGRRDLRRASASALSRVARGEGTGREGVTHPCQRWRLCGHLQRPRARGPRRSPGPSGKGKTVTAATGRHTAVGKSELETAKGPEHLQHIKLKVRQGSRAADKAQARTHRFRLTAKGTCSPTRMAQFSSQDEIDLQSQAPA